MSYPHRKGQGSPKLALQLGHTRIEPDVINRLDAVIAHMKRDPYVIGKPTTNGAARAALMLGLVELEKRYGILKLTPHPAEGAEAE